VPSLLKRKLAQGEFVIGTWVTMSDPAGMEILSQVGFDVLLIDGEHAPRVYAGIHFRSACEDGLALGRKIGQRVATMYLQPVRR
jgi:hypothetical protein